jgi:dsDNA-specific endonuclease/ATPase MutS2
MTAFKGSLRSSGNIQSDSMKYLTIFMYIFFYIYNIVQTFESASMFQKIRYDLKKKMENVNKFVATFYKIKSVRNEEVENEMVISILPGLSGFYQIAQDPLLKNKLKNILKYLYDIDIMNVGRKLIKEKVCCFVKFSNKSTKMIDMSHVQFGKTGIKNNMTLAKNIIITGPNAAGKTTYIKSIFTNTILSIFLNDCSNIFFIIFS